MEGNLDNVGPTKKDQSPLKFLPIQIEMFQKFRALKA